MGETTRERERMTERELDRLLAEDGYGVRLLYDAGFQVWELWELMDSGTGWIVGHFSTPEEVCEFVGIYA
tara:strand:+ start:297 stop:506 length:210 start_codon:yes stop_codon:yes gene_type:complete